MAASLVEGGELEARRAERYAGWDRGLGASILREGVTLARETLERVREKVAGVQVSAPLGRVDLALQVFEGLVESATA